MKEAASRLDIRNLDQDIAFQDQTGKHPLGVIVPITQLPRGCFIGPWSAKPEDERRRVRARGVHPGIGEILVEIESSTPTTILPLHPARHPESVCYRPRRRFHRCAPIVSRPPASSNIVPGSGTALPANETDTLSRPTS